MVKPRLSLLVCAYLAAAATAVVAQSSYVFQLPGLAQTGQTPQIEALGDNDFGRILGPASSPNFTGATKVVATPDGTKFYIVTSAGMFETKNGLNNPTPLSAIAGAITDAQMTADGKYLFVIASHLYIVNTATDAVAADADTGVPPGATPAAVAVSHDGKTAWVLSNASGSTITTVDLTPATPVITPSQLSLLSHATSMVLSPRNLLYVTAGNRIFEIDPITLAITQLGEMPVSGQAGPLQFTPDGTTAYFVNQGASGSPVFKLNVQIHAISELAPPSDGSAPPTVDQMLVAGNNRVFALSSATRILYDVSASPFALTPAVIGVLPTGTVAAAAVSNEVPSARYLYLLFADLTFDRINLASNGVDQLTTLDPAKGAILSFVPIPAQSGAATLSLINASQTVTPGSSAVLIGQLLDSVGRPVMGATATFSANAADGTAITNPVVTTTAGGWAQTLVGAPALTGNYTVTLTAAGLAGGFTLNVSDSSSGNNGGPAAPAISIYAGDGELLRQNQSTNSTVTHVPLTVRIVDQNGNAIPNVSVTFGVEPGGIGSTVALNQGVTDQNGLARADYISASLPNNATIQLSKVLASSVYGTVEFYEVTHNALSTEVQPDSQLVTPSQTRVIQIPQGGFQTAAIAVSTISEKSPGPIPNVGLRLVDDGNNPAINSTIASCVGSTRADASGVSHCDLQMLPGACDIATGSRGIILEVGERVAFSLTLNITQGTASVLTRVTDQNQTGTPGNKITLVANVTDGCGQAVAVNGLSWGIIQGSDQVGVLSSSQSSSDSGGNVSAQVTLGQTAGVLQVRLSGAGLAPIVFNVTNQVSVSGISLFSGGGQSAVVGRPFSQPVIFSVHDAANHPVQGALVTFSVSGSGSANASLNPGSTTSDVNGKVQTTVTAGSAAGSIVITATVNTFTATATLSSTASGPALTTASFTNAASGSAGMTPCGFVTVAGSGVAPGVQGVVAAVTFFGAYPYSLAGLSIAVNGTPVPIQAVANDQFGQRANFQAPCELSGSSATVVVTVNGASTVISGVPVFQVQPGIFTYTGPNNKAYGAVIREADGTYVTSANPARRGEKVYVVVTGLGQATPTLITNSAGTGSQNVILPAAVFLSGRGLPALSARYLFGWVGAYLVEFQVPADSPTGPDQTLLVIATTADGTAFLGVSNTVLVPSVIANDTGTGGTSTGGGTGTGGGGTGTGGGGTGTGGGGTGTGGGGTGTGSATTPTQDEINSWIARGYFTSGQVSLTRSTAYTTTDTPGGSPTTSSTKTDSFSGQFTKTSGSDLSKLLNNQLPSGFPVLSPAVGTCSVYSIASLTNPFPNLTTVNLDAGPQLTSNGPNGTQLALRQNAQGVGFIYSASNVPNTYLAAGHYTLSGPGGADIGIFSGDLDTVADLVVTNPDSFKLISRNGGITVNWTGGEQSNLVFISGSSATINLQTQSISGSAFICSQNVSAGQFTVPASILTQLAASQVTTIAGFNTVTRGTFSVTASGKGARFTSPSGVDILSANNSWVWTFTPQYQ